MNDLKGLDSISFFLNQVFNIIIEKLSMGQAYCVTLCGDRA